MEWLMPDDTTIEARHVSRDMVAADFQNAARGHVPIPAFLQTCDVELIDIHRRLGFKAAMGPDNARGAALFAIQTIFA